MIEKLLIEKIKTTEWMLADLFACTPLDDIDKFGEMFTFQNEKYRELYTFKGKPILDVDFIFDESTKAYKWVWHIFSEEI